MLALFVNTLLLSFVAIFVFFFSHIAISGLFGSSVALKPSWIKLQTRALVLDFSLIIILLLGNHFHFWHIDGVIYQWLKPHLILNSESLVYFSLTWFISITLIKFSNNYLFRDPWYGKFYLNLSVFIASLMVASLANQFLVFIVAWELVGITSVFLIAYYQDRKSTVKNAFRTLVSYKIGDVCPYIAIIQSAHHGITSFEQLSESQVPEWIYILFLIAAMVKSAQYPFSYWLPRAMEGPTPTSAVFYGSMAVHLGVFLLLRVSPPQGSTVNIFIMVIGVMTLLHSSFVGRAIPDIKKSYSYATMSQLAVMFIEISLGFKTLALLHLCSHSILRFYQFLQVPSILHRRSQIESNIHKSLRNGDRLLESIFQEKPRRFLYYQSFDEGMLHFFRKKLIVAPIRFISYAMKNFFSTVEIFPRRIHGYLLFFLTLLPVVFAPFVPPVTIAPALTLTLLLLGLGVSMALFSENGFSSFFSKVFLFSLFVYSPFFLFHENTLVSVLFGVHLFTLLFMYVFVPTLLGFNIINIFYVNRFLGLFKRSSKEGRWVILFLLLITGTPMSPLYFVIESASEFYFEKGLLFGILYSVSNMFFVLSFYRFIFQILFGSSDITSRTKRQSLYVPEQYVANKR